MKIKAFHEGGKQFQAQYFQPRWASFVEIFENCSVFFSIMSQISHLNLTRVDYSPHTTGTHNAASHCDRVVWGNKNSMWRSASVIHLFLGFFLVFSWWIISCHVQYSLFSLPSLQQSGQQPCASTFDAVVTHLVETYNERGVSESGGLVWQVKHWRSLWREQCLRPVGGEWLVFSVTLLK